MSLGGTYTFSPSLLLDGNAAYTRLHLAAENTDLNTNYGSDVLGIPGPNGPRPWEGFPLSGEYKRVEKGK